ncbi:MAG: hypothetical protein ABSB41_06805 [Anaerolineales bacterium]
MSAVVLGMTACSGLILPATDTPTPPLPSPTETATIIWFPPTITPTVFPTNTFGPTQEPPTGIGSLIFTDAFDQPALWNTAISASASAVEESNRLILSLSGPGPSQILSLRSEPVLGNFYAEATASLQLCLAADSYGVLFRASPGGNYYRLVLNCKGQMRLERVRSNQAEPLGDWLSSGDIPTGAPADVKFGIWAVGGNLRFFLNDRFQFSAKDPLLSSGTLGFFIKANGLTPVTVDFLNLSVYSVSAVALTQTAVPLETPSP